MKFYILKEIKSNSWHENEFLTFSSDYDRSENDPLYPKLDFNHAPFCPLCHRKLRVYQHSPLRREIHLAKPYYADVSFSHRSLYCTSRFRNLYIQHPDFKGIEQFRKIDILKVYTHNGVRKAQLPPLPEFYMVDVVVDGAAVDFKKSKAVLRPPIEPVCKFCKKSLGKNGGLSMIKHSGLYIDVSNWNNNDIFYLVGIGNTIAVTDKFKEFINDNHLTVNFTFCSESEVSGDLGMYDYYVKKYGQEGLRYDLDEP